MSNYPYLKQYEGIYTGQQKLTLVKGRGPDEGEVYGDGTEFLKKVLQFVDYTIKTKHRAISVLDYGCGRAMHTHNPSYNMVKSFKDTTIFSHFKGMIQSYYCYDPAVPRYSTKPSQGSLFDLVAIPDVLEHVPEEHVAEVIKDCSSFVKDDGLLVATISNNKAYSHFTNPDGTLGENLHCTLKPIEWWINLFHSVIVDRAFVIGVNDTLFMKSINSRATVIWYNSDTEKFKTNQTKFPFVWYNK